MAAVVSSLVAIVISGSFAIAHPEHLRYCTVHPLLGKAHNSLQSISNSLFNSHTGGGRNSSKFLLDCRSSVEHNVHQHNALRVDSCSKWMHRGEFLRGSSVLDGVLRSSEVVIDGSPCSSRRTRARSNCMGQCVRKSYPRATSSIEEEGKSDGTILLVGVTGGTGNSVLSGLLESGVEKSKLRVLTRNPASNAARDISEQGVGVIGGDLDDATSVKEVVKGVRAIYCHATSKDAAKAEPEGEIRAERLAKAAASAGAEHIVYNSSGGGGHGISQVEQKHNIEKIFKESGIPTTNLQATMFMEEFWKVYTRPQILKGTFPFSMPGDKPLQLLAVKDMGLAAGVALNQPDTYGGISLELAGDELTPLQMCEAYSKAQGAKVSHFSPPKFLFWFLNRDLYRISKFLSEEGYNADITDCNRRFPGLLTFSQFLELTHWGDASRNYADGFKY